MIGTKDDGEIFGMEKFADEVNDISRDGYIIRRWVKDEGYEVLLDIEYLFGMFTAQAEIKNDKPFTVTLTETPESFAKRQTADADIATAKGAAMKWISIP